MNVKIYKAIFVIGLGLGLISAYFFYEFKKENVAPQEPRIEIPKQGIYSSELALVLFKAQLELSSQSVCLSPMALEHILVQLRTASAGNTRELLSKLPLPLPSEYSHLATPPLGLSCLAVDNRSQLEVGDWAQQLLMLKMGDSPHNAIGELNQLAQINTLNTLQRAINSDLMPPNAGIIGVATVSFQGTLLHPLEAEEHGREFHCEEGEPKLCPMLTSSANYRVVRGGNYVAVSLFYQASPQCEGNPTCALIVMPTTGKLRDFCRLLTADKLAQIRRELALAAPRPYKLTLPALELSGQPTSCAPLMDKLGLSELFSQQANYLRMARNKLRLSAIVECYAYNWQGSFAHEQPADSETSSSGDELLFDRPFIWMVGDLTSGEPPVLMGTFE